MPRLTREIMMLALAQNDVAHSSRARAAELLVLYQTIPEVNRRAFEIANGINIPMGADLNNEIDVNEETDGATPTDDYGYDGSDENTNDSSENANNDFIIATGPAAMIEIDAELELLRKQHEMLALREGIRKMKKRAAADAAAEMSGKNAAAAAAMLSLADIAAGVVSATCPIDANANQVSRNEQIETRSSNIALPMGHRTTPPRAAIALPNNCRRADFRDLENTIVKFTGEDVTYDVRSFLRQFEEIMDLLNGDETFRLLSLRRSLSGAAKELLHSAQSSTYESLRATLMREFGDDRTSADIEAAMRRRKWQKNTEGLHRYILEMQRFQTQMGSGQLTEQQVVDLMITNMQLPMQEDILLRGSDTVDALKWNTKRYAASIEMAVKNAARPVATPSVSQPMYRNTAATAPTACRGAQAATPAASAASAAPAAPAVTDVSLTRCYNCNVMGHYKIDCLMEVRPTGICFNCWQPGHTRHSCTNPRYRQRRLSEINVLQPTNNAVGIERPIDWNDPDEDAEDVDCINLVSVAFGRQLNEYTGFNNYVSIFDTGSPISLARRSTIPFAVTDHRQTTQLRGLGGTALRTHGTITCNIQFNRRTHPIDLMIIPDETTVMPLILGRDFLRLFQIKLTQRKLMYSRTKLLLLNKGDKFAVPSPTYPRVPNSIPLGKLRQLDLLKLNEPVKECATAAPIVRYLRHF